MNIYSNFFISMLCCYCAANSGSADHVMLRINEVCAAIIHLARAWYRQVVRVLNS